MNIYKAQKRDNKIKKSGKIKQVDYQSQAEKERRKREKLRRKRERQRKEQLIEGNDNNTNNKGTTAKTSA